MKYDGNMMPYSSRLRKERSSSDPFNSAKMHDGKLIQRRIVVRRVNATPCVISLYDKNFYLYKCWQHCHSIQVKACKVLWEIFVDSIKLEVYQRV